MTKQTVMQLANALEEQRATFIQREAELELRLEAQIAATKPKIHVAHWISGSSAFIMLVGVIATTTGLIVNMRQQTVLDEKQNQIVAAQQRQAGAQMSQAVALRQMQCELMVGRAIENLRASPRAASQIFSDMSQTDATCKEVGVPVLATLSYRIQQNPRGLPPSVTKRAAVSLAVLSDEERVRLTDRFHLGERQEGGFDLGGVGPRVRTAPYFDSEDALGGRYYYLGRDELEIPVGKDTIEPNLHPRVTIGTGVNWSTPFGPFRIDFSEILPRKNSSNTEPFTFNVGTQF
jgi:Omp85 superfamily domain